MAIGSFEQIARDVLMTGNPVTGKDNRLYLDGTSTPLTMSQAIAEAIHIGDIFRDKQSLTKKYTVGAKVGDAVRVALETPFPPSSRTLALGTRAGTDGNGGMINSNAPFMGSNDEFIIYLNQVNDQAILFPDMQTEMMPLFTVASRIASYAKTVSEDRSASTLAEIIAYNVLRSLNEGDNINNIDISLTDAYATLVNNLHTKLDDGDMATNAHSYSTQGRCIIGRPQFVNHALNRKSGILLTGSDLAQSMLKGYNFDTNLNDREYVGNAYKGSAMNFEWVSAASYIWTLAERYLGLPAGALDHVIGIAVSYEATAATDNVDLGVKTIDANEVRGLKAQPLNCWGHEAFRKIQLIGDLELTNDTFTAAGFTDSVRKYPCAPAATTAGVNQILVPIYAADGETVTGYMPIVNVPKPNGGNFQSGVQLPDEGGEPTP